MQERDFVVKFIVLARYLLAKCDHLISPSVLQERLGPFHRLIYDQVLCYRAVCELIVTFGISIKERTACEFPGFDLDTPFPGKGADLSSRNASNTKRASLLHQV